MKTLGEVAYDAFAKHLTDNNYQAVIPAWSTLSQTAKTVWEVTAKAVVNEYIKQDIAEYRNALNVLQTHAVRNIYGSDK